jgi:hypothetical protein
MVSWQTRCDLLLLAVVWAHVFLCPYTKVEESFNVQAIHDFLYTPFAEVRRWLRGPAREPATDLVVCAGTQFDHLEFPGVVPRTSIGALATAIVTWPAAFLIGLFTPDRVWVLIAGAAPAPVRLPIGGAADGSRQRAARSAPPSSRPCPSSPAGSPSSSRARWWARRRSWCARARVRGTARSRALARAAAVREPVPPAVLRIATASEHVRAGSRHRRAGLHRARTPSRRRAACNPGGASHWP